MRDIIDALLQLQGALALRNIGGPLLITLAPEDLKALEALPVDHWSTVKFAPGKDLPTVRLAGINFTDRLPPGLRLPPS